MVHTATMKTRTICIAVTFCAAFLFLFGCATNPMTGKRTMAFVSNDQLFSMASDQYTEVLSESTVVTGTPEAEMLSRVGWRLVEASQKWVAAEGRPNYLDDSQWAFTLIQDDAINAWAMPGGMIAFYTGILPVTQNEAGIAVVMGHEIAHAILNHGQQRMSAAMVQEMGMTALGVGTGAAGLSPEIQAMSMSAFGVGSSLFGTLPFSRSNEDEADLLGLKLMAIAGYNPEEAVTFWERMNALSGGGGGPQWLSTHPSHEHRVRNLRRSIPEAQRAAARFDVTF
jgi:predicted Zn-dependent protease